MRSRGIQLLLVLGVAACAPHARPLAGTLSPERRLPAIELPAGHRRLVFRWDYEENALIVRGEGSIRIASPDSARVDLFLNSGVAVGRAVLIGNRLRATNRPRSSVFCHRPHDVGCVRTPCDSTLPDTVVTVEGDVLHADIGRPADMEGDSESNRLMQLAGLSGRRIAEVVLG